MNAHGSVIDCEWLARDRLNQAFVLFVETFAACVQHQNIGLKTASEMHVSLHIFHCCPLLYSVLHCCPLLSTVDHCCPLFSTVVNCCPMVSIIIIIVHFFPLLSIVIHNSCPIYPLLSIVIIVVHWLSLEAALLRTPPCGTKNTNIQFWSKHFAVDLQDGPLMSALCFPTIQD